MKLHLDIHPSLPGFSLNHNHKILLTGSCFSNNIGQKLQQHRFTALSNPWGVLFNPISILQTLEEALGKRSGNEAFFIENENRWCSFMYHSTINASGKDELLEKINAVNRHADGFLSESEALFITFGSAFYYHHLKLNATVANCHKQPGSHFIKKLCTTSEICDLYNPFLKTLVARFPQLKVVFSISPVKHLRDGVIENNLSKAHLISAVHELVKQNTNAFYFPAFELVNDDLRDYRFYKEDHAHPNDQAVKYVWQKFSETYFTGITRQINQLAEEINKARAHHSETLSNKGNSPLAKFIAEKEEMLGKMLKAG